jgi:transcriptional regulator with XRE-family HTH domain
MTVSTAARLQTAPSTGARNAVTALREAFLAYLNCLPAFHLLEELEALRTRHGLTVNGFAQRARVSPSYMADVFAGNRRGLGIDVAIRIAQAFGEPCSKWLRVAGHGRLVDVIDRESRPTSVPGVEPQLLDGFPLPTGFLRHREFALRIPDNTMAPMFPAGSLAAVEPVSLPPTSGLVALDLPDGTRTVRYRRKNAGRTELAAQDLSVAPIPDSRAKVIGVPRRVYIATIKEVTP